MKITRLLQMLTAIFLCAFITGAHNLNTSTKEDSKENSKEDKRVGSLRILVLSTMLADEGIGEWGFAALVEVDGKRILFDTGARPETVLRNARELKIDLSHVSEVVLSHNHDDHTGGLVTLRRELMKQDPAALSRAHVGKGAFYSRPSPEGEQNQLIVDRVAYEA